MAQLLSIFQPGPELLQCCSIITFKMYWSTACLPLLSANMARSLNELIPAAVEFWASAANFRQLSPENWSLQPLTIAVRASR